MSDDFDDLPDTFRPFASMPSAAPVTSFGSCGCTPDRECRICSGQVEAERELARAARQSAPRRPVDVAALWERYAGIPREAAS